MRLDATINVHEFSISLSADYQIMVTSELAHRFAGQSVKFVHYVYRDIWDDANRNVCGSYYSLIAMRVTPDGGVIGITVDRDGLLLQTTAATHLTPDGGVIGIIIRRDFTLTEPATGM